LNRAARTYTRVHIHMHTHTHIHACTHARAQTNTHTHVEVLTLVFTIHLTRTHRLKNADTATTQVGGVGDDATMRVWGCVFRGVARVIRGSGCCR